MNVLQAQLNGLEKQDLETGHDYCYSNFFTVLPYSSFESDEEKSKSKKRNLNDIDMIDKERAEMIEKFRRINRQRVHSYSVTQLKEYKEKYKPQNVSIFRKSDPKPYSDERFQKLVSACKERFYLKNKDVKWELERPYRGQQSVSRYVPLTDTADSTMLRAAKRRLEKMEKSLLKSLARIESEYR